MRWSGPWKTDRLLKTAMVLTGTVLVLALAKPLAGETMKMISQHSKIPWKMAAAEFLADFFKKKEDPMEGFWKQVLDGRPESKGRTEDRSDPYPADPAYTDYERRKKIFHEAAWMFLMGDESGAEAQEEAERLGFGRNAGTGRAGSENDMADAENENGGSSGNNSSGNGNENSQALGLAAGDGYQKGHTGYTGGMYQLAQLQDYDFLIKHFYTVHSSTTARREEMDAAVLTGMDLSMKKDPSVPQILIYHTHSQETYADYAAGNKKATVVELGNRLTALLEEKGYQVLHDTTSYDMAAGKLDRNHAYNYALDGIMGILQKYPSIQVVLDLHRDGVKESLHMVRTVNGKATAPIMFFNGMSQTPEGEIEYLKNPYKTENLAFSLQMQLLAEEEYPDLTRKIFLKGLRYNLHVRPRSALIEVGAQTNTLEEALNAMEPLADLLDQVLGGGGDGPGD
jgi:stage II sporulation protein P